MNKFPLRGNVGHGFLRATDGTVTTFDAPDAGTLAYQGTFVYDINGAGEVTGTYIDINTVNHAFIRNADGSMILIDVPEAGTLSIKVPTARASVLRESSLDSMKTPTT